MEAVARKRGGLAVMAMRGSSSASSALTQSSGSTVAFPSSSSSCRLLRICSPPPLSSSSSSTAYSSLPSYSLCSRELRPKLLSTPQPPLPLLLRPDAFLPRTDEITRTRRMRGTRDSISFRSYSSSASSSSSSSSSSQFRLPDLIADIHARGRVEEEVVVRGWVRTVRQQKQNCFLEVSDGSCQLPLQIVTTPEAAKGTSTGCSVEVRGKLVPSPGKQKIEVQAQSISITGSCDPETFPLAKKRHSFEFLREMPHLRPRTNTFGAVLRVRDAASFGLRQFFKDHGFVEVNTPILTSSDCEGAGEQFTVSANVDPGTLASEQSTSTSATIASASSVSSTPAASTSSGNPQKASGDVDNRKFFGRDVSLTVSGQLQAEIMACALSRVYTFGPTFRADNSNTRSHLAEFWMIEPEMAFADMGMNLRTAEHMVKGTIQYVLDNCPEEMAFFQQRIDSGLMQRLKRALGAPFNEITYDEAVKVLEKSGQKFEFPVKWGLDLQKEHERYIVEKEFGGSPTFVTHYPTTLKPFYMKLDDDGRTVQAMDLLVPTIGELIGGSVREEREDVLRKRMKEMGMGGGGEDYEWYIELRRFGTVPHAGFGMGFERFVQYITGMENIRDVVPVPRYRGSCRF